MNKAFWRILPLIGLVYLFTYKDRANVSFAAAINTMSQIGAFVAPFGWGLAKDATGGFQAALLTFSFITLVLGGTAGAAQAAARGQSATRSGRCLTASGTELFFEGRLIGKRQISGERR